MSASVTEFDKLKSELEKSLPDFEKVCQIISVNKDLLNKPIGYYDRYVLHYACLKKAPSNIVIKFINDNRLAVQQKDNIGCYPLRLACLNKQPESVIQLLIKEYPLALQQNNNFGCYPLHCALLNNQSESVIELLVKEYPLAAQLKTSIGYYPLHLACQSRQSERVLLVLINLSLHAVKHKNRYNDTALSIAKKFKQSSTIIKVLEELTTMSDYDLENRIGIPTIIILHGLDNLRRNDIFQWVMHNSPILIDGKYISKVRVV